MPLHPGSIRETFAMLMAKCITSFSLGDGLEGHFQAIFQIFSTIFCHELWAPAIFFFFDKLRYHHIGEEAW